MRNPSLYDFVYLRGYGKALFQVISVDHSPVEKYPRYELLNAPSLIDVAVRCPLPSTIEGMYGVPLADIELHFMENSCWRWEDADEELHKPLHLREGSWVVVAESFELIIKENGDWSFPSQNYAPEPYEMEYIHEVQQWYRGIYGEELPLIK